MITGQTIIKMYKEVFGDCETGLDTVPYQLRIIYELHGIEELYRAIAYMRDSGMSKIKKLNKFEKMVRKEHANLQLSVSGMSDTSLK